MKPATDFNYYTMADRIINAPRSKLHHCRGRDYITHLTGGISYRVGGSIIARFSPYNANAITFQYAFQNPGRNKGGVVWIESTPFMVTHAHPALTILTVCSWQYTKSEDSLFRAMRKIYSALTRGRIMPGFDMPIARQNALPQLPIKPGPLNLRQFTGRHYEYDTATGQFLHAREQDRASVYPSQCEPCEINAHPLYRCLATTSEGRMAVGQAELLRRVLPANQYVVAPSLGTSQRGCVGIIKVWHCSGDYKEKRFTATEGAIKSLQRWRKNVQAWALNHLQVRGPSA